MPNEQSQPAPLRRQRPRLGHFVFTILLAASIWRIYNPLQPPESFPFEQPAHRVRHVIDGDTLVLANGNRVRLIGVDTPEVKNGKRPPEPLGNEATRFTREQIGTQSVRLEFDRERYDRYGRILAYVWIDDWLLNEQLILEGLSPAVTGFPYRSDMKTRFRNAEVRARERKTGLWAEQSE